MVANDKTSSPHDEKPVEPTDCTPKSRDELQNELAEVFKQLIATEEIELDKDTLATISRKLCVIYSNEDFRHSYSKISEELGKNCSPDERDVLCTNLGIISKNVDKSFPEGVASTTEAQKSIKRKIEKLCDHVNLESIRLGRIDRVEHIGETAKKAVDAAGGTLEETAARAGELKETVDNFHAQSITILGIFAGLVITFSGVLQFTGSAFGNLSDVAAHKIVLLIAVAFFFLFNIVFMLMYCISKISGKSIAVGCRQRNCDQCGGCSSFLARLNRKYPYALWFDIIALFVCATCFLIA